MNKSAIDPINENGFLHFFGISTWPSLITLMFVIVVIVILSFLIYKKRKTYTIITSFILGFLGLGLFMTLKYFVPVEIPEGSEDIFWINEANDWLNLFGTIFISLLVIIIPLYLFTLIITFITNDNAEDIKKRDYSISFISLSLLSFVGIIFALLLSPIILSIPKGWFISEIGENVNISNSLPGLISSSVGSSLSIFTNITSIISIVIFAILISISIKLANNEENNITKKSFGFFNNIKIVIEKYLMIVLILIPIAIATKIASIGLQDSLGSLKLMGTYLGIFWLGGISLFIILFIANLLFKNKNSKEKRFDILSNQVKTVFLNQSTIASISSTISTSKKLGVDDKIANLTPTMGTVMGMIMCNGFSPMLIVLFSLANYGSLSLISVFIAIVIIMMLTVSSSGSGSADYTIILATLGTLGISSYFYTSIILPIQEINEVTIVKPVNTLGHLFATQLTNKFTS